MANKTMKTLTMNSTTYEIVDETSRKNITNKVDKVDGKGLSTNDYTTNEKNKLAGIASGANKTVVDSSLSSSSTNPVQNKVVNTAISNLNTLVGNTAVSTQISNAISELDMLTVDITNVEQGTATGINADTLGGVDSSEYALKSEINSYTNDFVLKSEINSYTNDFVLKSEINSYIENMILNGAW